MRERDAMLPEVATQLAGAADAMPCSLLDDYFAMPYDATGYAILPSRRYYAASPPAGC